MSLMLQMLLLGVVLPFGMTVGVELLLGTINRYRQQQPTWTHAVSLAAGFTAAYLALFGWAPFPVHETSQWTFYFALGAIPMAWLTTKQRLAGVFPQPMKAVFVFLAIFLTIKPLWGQSLSLTFSLLWLLGLSASTYLLWYGLDWILRRWDQSSSLGQITACVPLLVLTGSSSIALLLSGSARLGQLGGILTASAFALAFLVFLRPTATLSRAANTVLVPLVAMLLVNGAMYADLPFLSLLLLLLSPLPFVVVWPLIKGMTANSKEWITIGSHLLFVAIALGIAMANQPAPYTPY